MGRSESAAKDVQRQRKEEETPEEVAVGWAGLDPSKDKDLGCALSLWSTLQKRVLPQLYQKLLPEGATPHCSGIDRV